MSPIVRSILATIAGLVAGNLANMAIIQINTVLHPMPEGIDTSDMVKFGEYVAGLPMSALLTVTVAHLSQAFVGGWLAARLAASRPMLLAMIIAGLTMVGGIAMMMMVPHPAWMWIEVPLYFVVAWVAANVAVGRRQSASS